MREVTTFLLIRHATNDFVDKALAGRLSGVHLNEEGRRQAEILAERLQHVTIDSIYSSPLERALQTAEPLARRMGLTIQLREKLLEIETAEWTGKTFDALAGDPQWKRFNSLRSATRCRGGEHMLEVQLRIVDELEELRERSPDRTVAVISHGDVIKGALAHYLGVPLDLFHRIEISPASISTLALADWGPRILGINDTGSLCPA